MKVLRGWIVFSWLALLGVMAGGALMLRRLTAGGATHEQLEWVRDGHAHGGVLILMSILYFSFLEKTSQPNPVKHLSSLVLVLGIAAQAGGFFLHGFAPRMATTGAIVSAVGAAMLTVAIVVMVVGLLRTQIQTS